MQKALSKNNTLMGSNKVQIMPIPREQVEAVLSSFGDDNGKTQNRPTQNRDWAPPSDFGSPGCVVMISNLCYRATIEDIVDVFSEFDLHPDQIIRRYNDVGQPTGNACVNFNSPMDADRACDSYNKAKVLNRPIWLRRA
jgi:RNA recognition motif-containing protein